MLKLIVGLIVLAGIGATAFYFVSDPFRTKVAAGWKNATEWTPERRAADPAGLLNFSLMKLDDCEKQLQAREIALRTQQNQFTRERDAKKQQLGEVMPKLTLLRVAYLSGKQSGVWPVSTSGLSDSYDESTARKLIVQANARVVSLNKTIGLYDQSLKGITANLAESEKTLAQINDQRLLASAKLEEVKMKQAVGGIDQISNEVAAIGDRTGAIVTKPHDVSIDDVQLSAPTGTIPAENDAVFQQILAAK